MDKKANSKLADPKEGKLPIGDRKHVVMAREALSPAGFRGNRVKLPPADMATARKKVDAAAKRLKVK